MRAIEIGPAMAARLRTNLPSDRLRISVGDFEDVSIDAGSADAVFSATAYHWISRSTQTDRPAAVLRSAGVERSWTLEQVDSLDDSGFFTASQPIYQRYGQGHTGPPAPPRDRADSSVKGVLQADDHVHSVAVLRYDWNQTYSAAEYRLRMISYSGTQMMKPSDQVGLLDDIEAFIDTEFDGVVTRPVVVTLTTAVLA